ncbi:hypothetical protein SDC9_173972 [bioreactor metagenome]|uniref:Uncharacterized protein n=1 Tax=bioreactor metagenome TaxID=1076179 RepID=A0A645GHX8_9ZZZZ
MNHGQGEGISGRLRHAPECGDIEFEADRILRQQMVAENLTVRGPLPARQIDFPKSPGHNASLNCPAPARPDAGTAAMVRR